MSRMRRAGQLPGLVLVAATVVYAAIASYYSLLKHANFLTYFDLANFDQALWLLAQGDEPFITQHGRHLLGDHFDPTLVLLTPIYWAGGGPEALLILQALLVALVAPLLYKLARLRCASPGLALLPATLWLANPITLTQTIDDFHHTPVAAPLIVGSVVALQQNRIVLFSVAALLACGLKEDIPLMFAMLGIVVVLEGRRRLGAAIVTVGVALFAFATLLFMPYYSDSLDWFARRFAGTRGDSVADVAWWIVRNPVGAVEDVATTQNLFVVAALVVTSGGLCFLAPKWMLLALPAFAHNMLTAVPEQHQLRFHYWFPVILGLAIAGAVGVSRLPELTGLGRRVIAVWATAGFALFAVGVAYAEHQADAAYAGGREARTEALELVPDDVPVAASVRLTPHLAHRRELYTLPLPFQPADYGGDLTWAELQERARRVNYVVLDTVDTPKEAPNYREELPPLLRALGFREVAQHRTVHVFVRTP
jgi:uncharacterized membrane protein